MPIFSFPAAFAAEAGARDLSLANQTCSWLCANQELRTRAAGTWSILLVSVRCASVAGAASSPGRRRGQRFSHWPQMTQYWVNSQNCKRKCQRDQATKWTTRASSGNGGGHVNSRSRVFSYEHLPLSSSHLYSCRDRSPALPAQIFQEKWELWILCEPDGQPIETHKLKLTVWGYTDEHVPVTEREVKAASLLHFVRLQVTNSIK